MSSERPKLGPDIPKVITAWDSPTGRVVYLTKDRTWSEEIADAEVMTGAGAADVLAWAAKDQVRVADPYFMQVSPNGKVAGRETIRETIRARGPTNHPMFGKQAGEQLMPNRPISKMTLYGDSISGNCLKTKWTADWLGVDYDWVEVSVVEGGTRSDAFMSMNPSGQVPVMRLPDGRILPQSNAIMLYIAETNDHHDLVPEDPFHRAQMFSWLFWEQYSHEPYIAVRRFRKKFMNQTDDELDPQLLARGRRALGVMELQLTFSNYFVGETMTLADIALVAYTRWADEGGFDLTEFPNVQRWVARVETDLGIEHSRKAA